MIARFELPYRVQDFRTGFDHFSWHQQPDSVSLLHLRRHVLHDSICIV